VDRLPAIGFSYPREADITLTNTGSPDEEATVRADVPAGASITLRAKQYDLLQFHWHTPSEHRIGGRSRPMEMHLVHRAADGSLPVIGVLIKRGPTNRVLEPIFDDLPKTADETRHVAGVRLDDVLPDDRSSFRYAGSLTTPRSRKASGGSCSPTRSGSRNCRSAPSVSCFTRETPARSSRSTAAGS
jgi:carbonic anhydrase